MGRDTLIDGMNIRIHKVDCSPKRGIFTVVIDDERVDTQSIVFASITELKDGDPHLGAATFTVHNVVPGDRTITVRAEHDHDDFLRFQLSLWIFGQSFSDE